MDNNRNRRRRRNRPMRRMRRKNRGVRQQGNMVVRDSPRFPNDVKQSPIHNRVIRYYVAGGATQAFTPADFLSIYGAVTNGSTSFIPLYSSVRLRRISIYYVPTNNFGVSGGSVTFAWNGLQNAPDNLLTDRGTATQPACIKVVPIPDSLASMWFDANSASVNSAICTIGCPQNVLVDFDFEFILATGAQAPLVLSVMATYTGGAVLTLHNGSGGYQPEGLPVIHT